MSITIRIQDEHTCNTLRTHDECKPITRFAHYVYRPHTLVRNDESMTQVILTQLRHDTQFIRTQHRSSTKTMLKHDSYHTHPIRPQHEYNANAIRVQYVDNTNNNTNAIITPYECNRNRI